MQANRHNRRKLRVVTLVDGIGLAGGAERLAREVVLRLDRDRFERTLCVSRWSTDRASDPAAVDALRELDDEGVGFLGLRRRGAPDLAAWRPLVALLRGGSVDILHAHKFGSNVWAAILGPLAGVPSVITHEHTWSFEGQPLRRFLDRHLIGARADACLAVSREDRRRMIEVEGIDPHKVLFVPNGIPPPSSPTGDDARVGLGIDPDAPVVGTVCALRPQKALGVLLEAAAALSREFPGARVLIAGEGPERASLEARIEALGLDRTVTLLGQRHDVPDLLRAFDVAVCCSDFEGTPLSVLEYMEASLPVVATRVGGVPDLIDDGVQGLLVDPGDPIGLADRIAGLLRDPDAAASMGARGRERQRAEFDIDVTVREVERIYEGLSTGLTAADLAREGY